MEPFAITVLAATEPLEEVVDFLFRWMGIYAEERGNLAARIQRCRERGAVIVARDPKGEIAGVLCASHGASIADVELVYIAISGPSRGKGLAERLICDVHQRLQASSYCAYVDPTNEPVLRHHRKMGFTRKAVALVIDRARLEGEHDG